MHEVIHLSLSSIANHLNTHFYNAQESYFVYTDAEIADSKVDPTIRFQQGIGYTPRALIWDLRGGFGSLKKYSGSYTEINDVVSHRRDMAVGGGYNGYLWEEGSIVQTIMTHQPILRSEYQKSLDVGEPVPQLTTKNTQYWSDYSRILYHPNSQLSLNEWEYDPINYPKGRIRGTPLDEKSPSGGGASFKGYDVGVGQWNQLQQENEREYLDRSFRPVLEKCDSLGGITIATDVDSAWGGFTSSMLAELVDEYISSKVPRFVWGLYDEENGGETGRRRNTDRRLSVTDNLSRIKSTIGLIEYSTLYIPLAMPKLLPESLKVSDNNSIWYKTALFNLVYEPISVLSSLRSENNRISMSNFADSIIGGSGNRTIVTATAASSNNLSMIKFSSPLDDDDNEIKNSEIHCFSKYSILRKAPKKTRSHRNPLPNYGIVDMKSSGLSPWDLLNQQQLPMDDSSVDLFEKYFSKQRLVDLGTDESLIYQVEQDFPFALPSSFPSSIVESGEDVYSSLEVTSAPSTTLKNMADYVSRFDRGTDDREELKDSLNSYADAYSWGWSDDEEYD